ncbi:MAG: hypothetical protein PHI06_07185 [Desulfobulbaceae bacterium]|nr:hypothetical protein [Desulfobulbaceae bacterium]
MNIIKLFLVGLCTAFLFSGCVTTPTTPPATTQAERQDVLYTCNCGDQCKCNSVSTKPGNCKCGKPLKWGHVIKVEGNEAILCMCKEGCICSIDPKDPTKCGCGMPVKRVNLQGTGISFCNCGGSCMCNTVSDKPASCKCGMPLKKAE